MKINSIRFRATILYSAILAVILSFFSLAVIFYSYHILREDLDHDLAIKAKEIKSLFKAYEKVATLERHPFNNMLKIFDDHYLGGSTRTVLNNLWVEQFKLLDLKEDYINILSENSRTILRSKRLNENLATLIRGKNFFNKELLEYRTFFFEKKLLRAINLPITYHKRLLVIQIYTSLFPITSLLLKLLLFSFIIIIVIVSLTSYMGRLIVSQILKPVAAVTELASSISHKNLNKRIEEQVSDKEMSLLVRSFNEMIERLQQSFNYINNLSAQVAHELKTPLAIMRGEIELALESDKLSLREEKVLSNCLEEIGRMLKVINDLLVLAKIENQVDILKDDNINVIDFMVEIYEALVVLALPKNITVSINNLSEKKVLLGNRIHLRRLFLNLISNAVKFTPPKGNIWIKVITLDEALQVTISDTGKGIAKEDQKHIYDRFFKIDSDVNNDLYGAGTGLGLSIVLSIVKMHNGTIELDSKLKKGSSFIVTLPLKG